MRIGSTKSGTLFAIFYSYLYEFRSIPVYLIWIKYISWFHYSFEAMMINQWDQVTNITCTLPGRKELTFQYH